MGTETRNVLILADNYCFPLINQTRLLTKMSEILYKGRKMWPRISLYFS